jgi:hypothetical protein
VADNHQLLSSSLQCLGNGSGAADAASAVSAAPSSSSSQRRKRREREDSWARLQQFCGNASFCELHERNRGFSTQV